MNKTEVIASIKNVMVNKRETVLVTTITGEQVWVPKNQFVEGSETVTFTMRKAGEKYTNRITKEEGVLKSDRNDLVGFGKQIVRKYSSLELIDRLVAGGITPSFSIA